MIVYLAKIFTLSPRFGKPDLGREQLRHCSCHSQKSGRPAKRSASSPSLSVCSWVEQKTAIPGGAIGLAFGFGAIWVVDRIDDGSLSKMLKSLPLRRVQK